MISIGINGFGRIGRCVARHIMNDRKDMQIVQINATGGRETNMHLLKYDSVHGRYTGTLQEPEFWTEERDLEHIKWQNVDVVLAMYHDQGLPVLKAKGFKNAANITLGLPFIRTSVDHGTALDLAGTGNISLGSFNTALSYFKTLTNNASLS